MESPDFEWLGIGPIPDVAADFQSVDRYQQVGAGVVVLGDYCAGLEFEFCRADSVFDEEDLFGAAWEDLRARSSFLFASDYFAVELRRDSSPRISMARCGRGGAALLCAMWAKVAEEKRVSPSWSLTVTGGLFFDGIN